MTAWEFLEGLFWLGALGVLVWSWIAFDWCGGGCKRCAARAKSAVD